jgi:hypothetical protein
MTRLQRVLDNLKVHAEGGSPLACFTAASLDARVLQDHLDEQEKTMEGLTQLAFERCNHAKELATENTSLRSALGASARDALAKIAALETKNADLRAQLDAWEKMSDDYAQAEEMGNL